MSTKPMKTAGFLQRDSIATQLIKVVFTLYCIIAILVTFSQVMLEYRYTKSQISDELTINQAIFEPVLAAGLWDLDAEQVQNVINGMLVIPIVTGVKIEQNDQLYQAVGKVMDKAGVVQLYDEKGQLRQNEVNDNSEMFSYTFTLNYTFREQAREVGQATLYSDSSAIIDRVEMGIILLIINSMIKTIALWLLFFWVGKRILLRPLAKLTDAIANIDFNTLDSFSVDLQNQRKNELTIIEHAFSTMMADLAAAKNKILRFNADLEATVTERTKQLVIAKEQAELGNQAKSIFMSRINHELRTPLNAILGSAGILDIKLNKTLPKADFESIKLINKAANHLLMLIEDILDIANMQHHDIQVPLSLCPLNEICTDSIAIVQAQIEDPQLQINFNPNVKPAATVYANAGRLRQVMLNLLTNAIKYNKPAGTVAILIHQPSAETLEIIVQDSGIGINEEDMLNIFNPFTRLPYAEHNCIDGSGIGLSIVKNLVEKMQGTITVSSEIGVGSQFTVTLATGETHAT